MFAGMVLNESSPKEISQYGSESFPTKVLYKKCVCLTLGGILLNLPNLE